MIMYNIRKIKTLQRHYENAAEKLSRAVAEKVRGFVSDQGKTDEKERKTLIIAEELSDYVDIPYILTECSRSDTLVYEKLQAIIINNCNDEKKLVFHTESDTVNENIITAAEWNSILNFFERTFSLLEEGVVIVHKGIIRLAHGSEYK